MAVCTHCYPDSAKSDQHVAMGGQNYDQTKPKGPMRRPSEGGGGEGGGGVGGYGLGANGAGA